MAKKNLEEQEDGVLEDVGSDPRVYELGFHLDPELPVEEVKKAYQMILQLIKSKGILVADCEPEKIQLAYTISRQETTGRRDFSSAYFAWIVYEALAENHSEVITTVSADRRVIRFIDLITTKDAARHSLEVHEISMKTQERNKEKETEETTVDADIDAAIERATV